MIELLTHANHTDKLNCAQGQSPSHEATKPNSIKPMCAICATCNLYGAILTVAQAQNPMARSTGKRGRAKPSQATNLIARLRDYSDDVCVS